MARLDESRDSGQDKAECLTRKEKLACLDKFDKIDKLDPADDCENGIETAIPLMKEEDRDWVVHAKRTQYMAGQFRDLGVMCLMILCLVLCLVFYMVCPKCLFGILLFSACLCPFFNPMNAPLWLALVLLVVSGWSFTAGNLSLTWNNGF